MNQEIDDFIKNQASVAENDFKKELKVILDHWKNESNDILEKYQITHDEQDERLTHFEHEVKQLINTIKIDLTALLQQLTTDQQKAGKELTEKILSSLDAQRNDFNAIVQNIDLKLEELGKNYEDNKHQLQSFHVNQGKQLKLGQELVEKNENSNENLEKIDNRLGDATENLTALIEKNENALQAIKEDFRKQKIEIEKARESRDKKLIAMFISFGVIIILLLILLFR